MTETSDPRPDRFIEFVTAALPELRIAAEKATGDPRAAKTILRHALADTALHWRAAEADDPRRFALDAVTTAANTLLHHGSGHDEPDTDEDPVTLARHGWQAARRLRRRRLGRWTVAVVVLAALVGSYLWSTRWEDPPEPAPPQRAGRVSVVDDGLAVLPPPELLRKSAPANQQLPGAVVPDQWSTTLTDSPVDAILAAVQLPGQPPQVVGDDGINRLVDAAAAFEPTIMLGSRSVAPDGSALALFPDDHILIVHNDGSFQDYPITTGVIDIAWYPDNAALMVTGTDGSFRLDPETGDTVAIDWYGQASTWDPITGDPVEFASDSTGPLVLRRWTDGPFDTVTDDPPPIVGWQGSPMPDPGTETLVRGCVPEEEVPVPTDYGVANNCLAVVGPDASVRRLLVATDRYPPGPMEALRADNGTVCFSVPGDSPDVRIVMAWTTGNGLLEQVFSVTADAAVALGPV